MKIYTCGFVYDASDKFLLVRKNKPEEQKGLLNGVGGKVEIDEGFDDCMEREWIEETGITENINWDCFYTEYNSSFYCAFYRGIVDFDFSEIDGNANDVGEILEAYDPLEITNRVDLMKNLYWIIPMSRSGQLNVDFKGKL